MGVYICIYIYIYIRKKAGEQMLRETSHSNAAQIGLKQQAVRYI